LDDLAEFFFRERERVKIEIFSERERDMKEWQEAGFWAEHMAERSDS